MDQEYDVVHYGDSEWPLISCLKGIEPAISMAHAASNSDVFSGADDASSCKHLKEFLDKIQTDRLKRLKTCIAFEQCWFFENTGYLKLCSRFPLCVWVQKSEPLAKYSARNS